MNNQMDKTDKIQETRVKLLTKLLPHLRKNGLQSVRMDEIAKVMEVSRATLYKYFSTKEDIVGFIIGGFIEYMRDMAIVPTDADQSISIRFQQIFEQSISLVTYFSEQFLNDLETGYPDWHDQFEQAMKHREDSILSFYQEGIQNGIFNELNGKLLIAQDEMLRVLLTAKYLMTNQATLEQVLWDYYQLKKIQLFKPHAFERIDDSVMESKIEHLSQKIKKNLF